MQLHNVEKVKEIKPGFTRASAIFGKNMILLFSAEKDVQLDNHHHPHMQYGFCFSGEFDLMVDGKGTVVENGMSYVINKDVPHSAVALSDYYSMDLKYIIDADMSESVVYGVMELVEDTTSYRLYKSQVGSKHIIQIETKENQAKLKLSVDKQYCLLCGNETEIILSDEYVIIEPMRIYALSETGEFELLIVLKGKTIFLVEA